MLKINKDFKGVQEDDTLDDWYSYLTWGGADHGNTPYNIDDLLMSSEEAEEKSIKVPTRGINIFEDLINNFSLCDERPKNI